MFNLENKITWKELAPSLQAMFKTLQSQITDVKNEVNNINISLGDINDHLTQIDKDITNLNNNITTIIQDTVEDVVGEMMFLNLAPKIGYYQEDKIEVISKYNMNVMKSYFIITHNNKDQEVLYFSGCDGSYERANELKIYKATRVNRSTNFSFQNEEIIIPGLDYSSYPMIVFIASGDKYIVALAGPYNNDFDCHNCTIFLIKTYMFDDPSEWNVININFIRPTINSQFTFGNENSVSYHSLSWIRYYYNFDKDILIAIGQRTWSYANNVNDKNGNNFGIFSFKVSSQQFLHFTSLGSIFDYITAGSGHSFDPNVENHDVRINNLNHNDEGREPYRYYYFPEQEILRVLVCDKAINGYVVGSINKVYNEISMTLVFGVPVSIWNGGTGIITKYSKKEYGIGMSNPMYGIPVGYNAAYFGCKRSYCIPCRNESSGYTYFCGYCSATDKIADQLFRGRTLVMKDSEQNKDFRGALYYAQNVEYIIDGLYTLPPDSSLYGKSLIFANGFNNKLYITAYYKNNEAKPNTYNIVLNSILLGNKFLFKGTNAEGYKIINFQPGTYETNSSDDVKQNGTEILVPGMYFNNNSSFGSTIESDPKYITNAPVIHEDNTYTFKATRMRYKGTIKDGFEITVLNSTTVTLDSNLFGIDHTISIVGNRYNPLGNYHVVFFQDRLWNNTTTKGRIYFIVVETNGKVHYFGEEFSSSWTSDWRDWLNGIRAGQYKIEAYIYSYVCISNRKMFFDVFIANTSLSNSYTRKNIILEFNSNFSNFTMTDCDIGPNMSDQNSITYIYSGDTIGLIGAERKWKNYPILIYTQKPLPGDTGTNYGTDDFLVNFDANKYAHYLESSQGLVAYIPSIPIFLGGYFSIIENPIPITLKPNSDNYIYIERDSNDRTSIIASSSTTRTINEGDKVFNKILCAKVTTDSANMISVEYYRINTGYNDYSFT